MKKIKTITLFAILAAIFIIGPLFDPTQFASGHTTIAHPTEIFSLWNNTSPTLDGGIDFSSGDMSTEWSSAAVYNLYNNTDQLAGKLLLQNSDTNIFIGMDVISLQVTDPATPWGCSVYLDLNHDGLLSLSDRLIRFTDNSTGQFVEYYYYSGSSEIWMQIEDGSLGTPLSSSGIVVASSFQTSEFDSSNNHRQYEIKVPLIALSKSTGDVIGIGLEATDNYLSATAGITWPYIGADQDDIRVNAGLWGDVHLESNTIDDFQFVVEENFNIKSSAVGYNNGTFLTTGDIDGNGDLELIVSSNRTVLGDRNLIAIYDYVSGELTRIWSSWTKSHQSLITTVMPGIVAYDFTGDGTDELYCIGTSNTIVRLSEWNTTSNDFEVSENIFTHSSVFMGYITIGDFLNGGSKEIIVGDQNANIVVLVYDSETDTFDHDKRSPFSFSYAHRIHAIKSGDMDNDALDETLFFGQTTSDNTLSQTNLFVYYRGDNQKLEDNLQDDLPGTSSSTTEDYFGHTILVDDVDNDATKETIIVGQNYLRIFESDTFTDPSPPLELLLNDPLAEPSIIGGAAIGDVDSDSTNELIFSSNNGTIFVGQVSDTGSLEFSLNWSSDFGSSFGKRNSIMIFDIDMDGQNEIVLGDQYGQILVLGQGDTPEISINSPSPGYVSSQDSIIVDWDTTTEFQSLHHIDVYTNGAFSKRIGGSQTSTEVFLTPGQNIINLTAYSMSGLVTSTNVTVKYDVKAPQVTIISPENNYMTSENTVELNYNNSDPDLDFDYYKIYRNDTLVVPSTTLETISIALPSDGKWNITVVAVDDTLLEGQSSIYVIRDTIAPFINIIAPLDGAAVKVTDVDVNWDSSDTTTDIDYYEIYLDSVYQDSTTLKTYQVSLSIDKTYLIEVYSYDLLGNYGIDSISISLDTIDPTIYFDPIALPQLPDSTYYTNNPLLPISWNATDNLHGTGISQTQITINGLLYDTYLPGTTSDILDLAVDNYKEIEITAFDNAGNTATDVVGVKLDREPPFIDISLPADNYTTGSDYVIISWDAIDFGVGIKEYRIYVDSILEDIIADVGITKYLINIPENKTYTVTIRAYDLLNQFNESSIDIIHDSSYPTVVITLPTKLNSYSNNSIIYFTWETVNLDVDHFEIYVNGSLYDTYSNTTLDAFVDFGPVGLDEYLTYNMTLLAFLSNGTSFLDLRWIAFDTTPPEISFISPLNDDIIINSNLHVEWFSQDDGSDIDHFRIVIGGISVIKDEIVPFTSIINISSLNGIYELIIFGYDKAGNVANVSINIEISLYAPVISTSLELMEYRNTGDFQFDLFIEDTNSGVKSIVIYVDNTNEIYYEDFGLDYAIIPFERSINVLETDFLSEIEIHNISISVFDKINREQRLISEIVIDKEIPTLFQEPIFGGIVLSSTSLEIEFSETPGLNNYTLSVFVRDNIGVFGVNVTLTGDNYNQTFQMIYNENRALVTLAEYNYTFNFDDFNIGEYQITITLIDISGNLNYVTYEIELIDSYVPILPNNFGLIIALIAATIVIVSSILVVSLRKPIKNIGWQDEIVNLSYILSSGLTVFYKPFSHDMIRDEQLFGGAMSGIRSILEELIGSKRQYAVDNVEFGNKHLLIYSSTYGDTILVVGKIKPIHSQKLEQFAKEFEIIYRDAISTDTYVNISKFSGYNTTVQKYFGSAGVSDEEIIEIIPKRKRKRRVVKAIKEIETSDQDLLIKSLHQKLSLEESSLDKISPQTKVYIGDAIVLAEKALTSLIEYDCDQAEKYAEVALNSMELAIQSGEDLSVFEDVLNAIPRIVTEVTKGSNCGDQNDTEGLYQAIENVSKLYLEYIEKFSI